MPEHTPAPTPSRAVYGFAMFLSFNSFLFLYLIWAWVPEEMFKSVGITCLPQRYWAVSVPIFLLTVLTIFAFFIYPSLGICMTPNINALNTIQDKAGHDRKISVSKLRRPRSTSGSECFCVNKEKCLKELYETMELESEGAPIPVLKDVNIWDVSKELYL